MDPHERWQQAVNDYSLPHRRLRQVARLVTETDPRSVADIGCATGYLRQLLPSSLHYVGIDFVAPSNGDFEFVRCDVNRDVLPDVVSDVDTVVCSGILEYVVDLPHFLSSLSAKCRPGTAVIASYFNMNHVSRAVALLRGQTLPVHPDWKGLHSPLAFEQMLKDAGLTKIRRTPSSHGLRASPGVAQTVTGATLLPRDHVWSPALAHQFIYELRA